MMSRRRALVAAGGGALGVVVAALVGVGVVTVLVHRGVRVAGFDVRARAVTPSLAGVVLDEVHAERRGWTIDVPRATVSGWPGRWAVDAPVVHAVRGQANEEVAEPAAAASSASELRFAAEQVDVRDASGGEAESSVVRVASLAFVRASDRTVEASAVNVTLERGGWVLALDAPVASRSTSNAWSLRARELRVDPREDDEQGPTRDARSSGDATAGASRDAARDATAAGASRAVPGDDTDRASELLGTVFVSGRTWLERAFERLPRVDATIDRVLVEGGALAPRVRLIGASASFVRDEAGARARVDLSTERSPAPLVVEARADAASLRVRVEAHGGPLELESDSGAELAADGEATFDAAVRRFEARGALRIRGVRVRRRWLGAAPFALDAGIAGHVVLDPSGEFRLEDGAFDFGPTRALRGRVSATGNLRALRLQADAALDPVDCNAAVVSLPEPVRATVGQLRFEGKKSVSVHLEASVSAPDDTRLLVRESGSCTAIAAPKELSPQAFDAPFAMPVTGADGRVRLETFGPGTEPWRPLGRISRAFLAAVLTTEDAGFFQHGGVAWYAIRSALVDDLKARRFVRGGSTITMQLAKNLFLNRDKNLGRKLEEVLLTDYLEDAFGKERILELYANVVELGPDVFGVEAAARHYFGVGAEELGVLEGMWLATLLPNPKERGHARRDGTLSEGKIKELRFLARKARSHGFLTDDDVADAEQGDIALPRREGVQVRVPGLGLEAPRQAARPAVIEGP